MGVAGEVLGAARASQCRALWWREQQGPRWDQRDSLQPSIGFRPSPNGSCCEDKQAGK